jgi:phytoene synthase
MTGAQAKVARQVSAQILAHHSKSFSLAGKLLPRVIRRDAAALYAWCRRCDDAVDTADVASERGAAVRRLWVELDAVYAGSPQGDPVLAGMQDVVRRHALPRRYAEDLLAGMAMDVGVVRMATMDDLLLYAYRAAGTVGLMMAHLMGIRDATTLRRATDLGIAMQLTNICRDVAEDEGRGRVYLPATLLDGATAPTRAPIIAGRAVAAVLGCAEAFYRSGDVGLGRLPLRCAVGIRAARLIYAEIGAVLARRGFDVRAGRAVVTRGRKLALVLRAVLDTATRRRLRPGTPIPLPFALPIAGAPAGQQDEIAVGQVRGALVARRAGVPS